MNNKKCQRGMAARKTISMPTPMMEYAVDKAEIAGYTGFSDYIQALIRADRQENIIPAKENLWQSI